ncbi:hypothetical protein CYMTET_35217 [Cymbomonas tetramitiformis]|uniref:Uncharacterized protein n=1 Tax=Cymbomonas tetramitiformis TaxID=36881 RepID=A0AAE0F9Q9_9CHLO|nr:hypothetical protein CYMTET_35217 [Cymbomonas tetramitiformis]
MQCLGIPRTCTPASTSFLRLRVWKEPRRNPASHTISLQDATRVALHGQLRSGGTTSICVGRQHRAAPKRSARVKAVDDEQRASEIEVREVVTVDVTEVAPAEDDAAPQLPWIALLALLGVFVSNQWSRALVYYVNNFDPPAGMDPAEAARRFANIDLGYGEQQYALLASFGFTAVFAAASLVAGRLADKQARPRCCLISLYVS